MADQKAPDDQPIAEGAIEPEPMRLRTRTEVAALMGISLRHLDYLTVDHGVPVIKLGRSVRFDAAAIEFLIAACRRPRAPSPSRTVIQYRNQREAEIEKAFQSVRKMMTRRPTKKRKPRAGSPKRK